jgi:hypothetical protein
MRVASKPLTESDVVCVCVRGAQVRDVACSADNNKLVSVGGDKQAREARSSSVPSSRHAPHHTR